MGAAELVREGHWLLWYVMQRQKEKTIFLKGGHKVGLCYKPPESFPLACPELSSGSISFL